MVTPPWMQAVVPCITEQAASVDPMAAVLAELKALRDDVAGLRALLDGEAAARAGIPETSVQFPVLTLEQAANIDDIFNSVTVGAKLRIAPVDYRVTASGYWNGSAT